jgi:hypothetical protein
MIRSPRKTRRGSWCSLVEKRDEWGSVFRGDPIKIKSQTVWAQPPVPFQANNKTSMAPAGSRFLAGFARSE